MSVPCTSAFCKKTFVDHRTRSSHVYDLHRAVYYTSTDGTLVLLERVNGRLRCPMESCDASLVRQRSFHRHMKDFHEIDKPDDALLPPHMLSLTPTGSLGNRTPATSAPTPAIAVAEPPPVASASTAAPAPPPAPAPAPAVPLPDGPPGAGSQITLAPYFRSNDPADSKCQSHPPVPHPHTERFFQSTDFPRAGDRLHYCPSRLGRHRLRISLRPSFIHMQSMRPVLFGSGLQKALQGTTQ
jgi:hypothetical protein